MVKNDNLNFYSEENLQWKLISCSLDEAQTE